MRSSQKMKQRNVKKTQMEIVKNAERFLQKIGEHSDSEEDDKN